MSVVPGRFFRSQGPPGMDAIVEFPGFQRGRQRISLDMTHDEGNIRLIMGSRGTGKSTCLYYLHKLVQREDIWSSIVDMGLYIPRLLEIEDASESINFLFKSLAKEISNNKMEDLLSVTDYLERIGKGPYFVFIDNLDRLYRNEEDLRLILSFFRTADPILKDMTRCIVVIFSCAPEWKEFLSGEDLSYLNFLNRIELKALSKDDIRTLIEVRAKAVGLEFEEIFKDDVIPALHVACRGNPRSAFQLLEHAMADLKAGDYPLNGETFTRNVKVELYKGSLETLREIAGKSPQISWGVNQLWRYFDALEKIGIDEGEGITLLLTALDKGVVGDSEIGKAKHAWLCVAHTAKHGQWELNPQVKNTLVEWGRATKIDRDILLHAYADEPFTLTTTEVEGYVEEYRRSLAPIPDASKDFDECVDRYVLLTSKKPTEWDRYKLVECGWKSVERLMLAIVAVRISEAPTQLRKELGESPLMRRPAEKLIERINEIYRSLDKVNPYNSELQALKERMLDVGENPDVVKHWETHQLEQAWKQAKNSFEGLVRELRPLRVLPSDTEPCAPEIFRLIRTEEGPTLELKSSVRWDVNKEKRSDELKWAVLKTIAGFLNSRGGILLLGVSDDRKVLGLQVDYDTLKDKNRDGFARFLTDLVDVHIGADVTAYVDIEFCMIHGKDVVIVEVSRAPHAVYLKDGKKNRFYIRSGNSTRELDAREAHRYIEKNW